MMYLIVVLVASVLLNLFLFVDRQALSKENDKLEKQLRVTKKQVQTFRQAFAASCKQVQQLLQHQYIQLSIEDSEYDEILKLLLDRLPVLLQSQVENGESHQVAMVTQKVTNVVSAEDFETFFKKQDRDMQRIWRSSEPDALIQLCLMMIRKQLFTIKPKVISAS